MLSAKTANLDDSGLNNIGHHQTIFFDPAHTFLQYNSLPRRNNIKSVFQRNTPIRRSTGIPDHHMEYFVPRSISEFNLSGVGDLTLPPPRRYSPNVTGTLGLSDLPHDLQLDPPQTLLCAPPPPLPPQMQIMTLKPREKMVTFEDESKALAVATNGAATSTHCPHGVPTIPRKTSTMAVPLLGSQGADIFI